MPDRVTLGGLVSNRVSDSGVGRRSSLLRAALSASHVQLRPAVMATLVRREAHQKTGDRLRVESSEHRQDQRPGRRRVAASATGQDSEPGLRERQEALTLDHFPEGRYFRNVE